MHISGAFSITTSGVLLLAALVTAGCKSHASAEADRLTADYDSKTGRLTRLEYDANSNGKPDTWAYMNGTELKTVEADENDDGRVDRWEYYGGVSLRTAGGRPVPDRIERATRFDGKVSRREFFERGDLARIEEDTDGDGALDKWETYSGRVLTVMALDTEKLGRPTRRLIYRQDGSLDRIEVDPGGTGQFKPLSQK